MNIDLGFYLRLFWRRLPVMMVFFILATVLGSFAAFRLPDTFSTDARLVMEAPQIPDSMVASTIRTEAVEQLDIIQQRLLTRANLIDIAQRFDVFENMGDMEPDTVVAEMMKATRFRRQAGRDRATLITIQFSGRSSRIVFNVVNEYVTLVLEENQSFRQTRANNTEDFFALEVDRLESDLNTASQAIAVFKSQNAEALPEDQTFRLQRQTLLQERISRTEREIAAAKIQREDIIRLFEQTGQLGRSAGAAVQRSVEEEQLIALEAEVNLLLADYSEENPRVKRMRTRIERLEAVIEARKEANRNGAESEDGAISTDRALLEANLTRLDSALRLQEEDLAQTQDQLAALQESIAQSSANGIELSALEREFEIVRAQHVAAVANLNAARTNQRIEAQAQGQRISVIENASVPSVPAGPDRPKIAIAGAGAGFLLAAAYFALLEILNRTIRRPAELVNRFNITPITTIPYMESRGRRFSRRAGLVFATLAVLAGVPGLLFYIDQTYLPLEVLVERGLSRLGIG